MPSATFRSGAVVLLLTIGCDLPRDPEDTLERARGGVVRVGVAENPPWVRLAASGASGVEPALVLEIARDLGARIEWVPGAQSTLLSDLHDRKVDLVIGGLTDDLPWKTEVAFTRPFFEDTAAEKRHVMATPPGENAWLLHLDRELHRRRSRVPALLQTAAR